MQLQQSENKFENIEEIIIGNVLEGFYKGYQSLPPQQMNYWILYDTLEGNRSLFYNDDNKVVITSVPILHEHFFATLGLMGWKNVTNIYPEVALPSICENLIRKSKLGETLEEIIKRNPGVKLIPYRATPEFYSLVKNLKNKGLNFNTPETIEEEMSFVNNYAGSKRGFREIWGKAIPRDLERKITIPMGFICANKEEAIEATWWFYKKDKSFVMKVNKGTQGIGILIVDHKTLPSTKGKFVKKMQGKLKEKIWDDPVIVVEEKIDVDQNTLGGSPSVEFVVHEDGRLESLYAGEQILDADRKTFRGFYIHPRIVKSAYIRTAYRAGIYFGKELAKMGYRGFYDIDLVISKDKRLYAVESNLRRTGATHMHQAGEALLGEYYEKKYHFAVEEIVIPQRIKLSYRLCKEIFKDMEYNKRTKEGIVYFNPDLLQVNILYLGAISKDKDKLAKMREEIRKRIYDQSPKLLQLSQQIQQTE